MRIYTLFRDIGMHANLGCTIEQIGGNRFRKQLILLLCQHLPFGNALAIFCPANGVLVALEEYSAEPHAGPASILAYLNGLYLLDPFYQACWEGLVGGLYRLEEIVPDHFWQSKYYPSYFHDNVPEGEMQFILQAPSQGALSLSLDVQRTFTDEECGMSGLLSSWALTLMQQHWQQHGQRPLPAALQEEMATQIRNALNHFGASVLSERELEIARPTLRSCSSKAMVERLAILPETIKVHRYHPYAELDISS